MVLTLTVALLTSLITIPTTAASPIGMAAISSDTAHRGYTGTLLSNGRGLGIRYDSTSTSGDRAIEEPLTTIIYVDADATGAENGSSWADAFLYLQDALDVANISGTVDCEIWVAEGIYYPDEDSDGDHSDGVRTESFRLNYDNVCLYGGFDPQSGADEWSERNPATHVTILSGDIDQDDTNTDGNGIAETWADIQGSNAYHVLWLDGVTNEPISITTRIDGFTITAGQANGSYPYNFGGGFYCDGFGSGHACSPTLSHLAFSGNQAHSGSGIYNVGDNGTSSPLLTNVILWGNQAVDGSQIYNYGATPNVTYSLVQGGHAGTGNIDAAP